MIPVDRQAGPVENGCRDYHPEQNDMSGTAPVKGDERAKQRRKHSTTATSVESSTWYAAR
ncbi:MAG: hypothetical protein ACJAV2_004620 [Myxococcota bacterium]|jgi:hypothetical protein